jgi:hypothetical protein
MSLTQCPLPFSNAQISLSIPKRTFQRLETIRQQTEIRKAALEGFYGCPFCSYGVCIDTAECEEDIGKEKEGKAPGLFKCRGKGCAVTSCMGCQRKVRLLPPFLSLNFLLKCDTTTESPSQNVR